MDRAIMNTSNSTCSVLGSILKLKLSGDVLLYDATLNSWPAADITPLGLSVICQELPINNHKKRLAGSY